jgi:hypothetical protein
MIAPHGESRQRFRRGSDQHKAQGTVHRAHSVDAEPQPDRDPRRPQGSAGLVVGAGTS